MIVGSFGLNGESGSSISCIDLSIVGPRLSLQARVEQSKQSVFPVPVGLSNRAFFFWNSKNTSKSYFDQKLSSKDIASDSSCITQMIFLNSQTRSSTSGISTALVHESPPGIMRWTQHSWVMLFGALHMWIALKAWHFRKMNGYSS
jgi:hypothetical protein